MSGARIFFALIAISLCYGSLSAQSNHRLSEMQLREEPISPNAINFEFGGNALVYSLNYDRILLQTPHYKGSLRIGVGILPYPESVKENRTWFFVPIEYNNLFGPKNHFLEVSVGTTYTSSLQGANHWITGRVGYRLQNMDGGFFLRTGMVLLYIPYANPQAYNFELQDVFLPMPTVAWGFSF